MHILVVDNEPDVRRTYSGFLGDAGHIVRLASNEGEALLAITQENSFDFVLVDVRLHEEGDEDESGLSLAMAIKKLDPKVHIILMTGYKPRPAQIVRAVRYHGVVDFIEKTTDIHERILKIIEEIRASNQKPVFEKVGDITQLGLSLTGGQPTFVRARGRYVRSARTPKVLQVDVERYTRRVEIARRDPTNFRFQIREIGNELWREVFTEHPEAIEAYQLSAAKSQMLSLHFEGPRQFLALPLEFMRSKEPEEYIVLQHPVSRFVQGAVPKREALSPQILALKSRPRVLVIASNTKPPIPGVDAEAQALAQYFIRQNYIDVMLLRTEEATYTRVQEELRKPEYDIIHYAGHGLFNSFSPEESSLFFWKAEKQQGDVVPMKATELMMLLKQSEARLVYLSSCYGTTSGTPKDLLDDDFLGLADAVAQAGVPSVIGFRWPVSDSGAPKLASAFYESLFRWGSPEVALWHARCAIDRDDPTWLSPILIHQE
jgi:CheY-like chemotaxis protein